MKLTTAIVLSFFSATAITQASIILGTGTGALIGGDLTDPENDIIDNTNDLPPNSAGANFNWIAATSNDPQIFFGDPSPTGSRQGVLDLFDNEVGGDINSKWCCTGPNNLGGSIHATLEFALPVQLTHFTIASGGDAAFRRPTDWSIQGSNDGVNFTPIFSTSGAYFGVDGQQSSYPVRQRSFGHHGVPRFFCHRSGKVPSL